MLLLVLLLVLLLLIVLLLMLMLLLMLLLMLMLMLMLMLSRLMGLGVTFVYYLSYGDQLFGIKSDNVVTFIRLGPAGGRFNAVYEAEGCTDTSWIGEGFFDGCMESYDSTKEDEDISCDKFLHRVSYSPYPNGEGRIDIIDMSISMGEAITAARTPLRFWPQQLCNSTFCGSCRDIGWGFFEVPMLVDGVVVNTTDQFRTGVSSTNEMVYSLPADKTLVFQTGAWSSVAAMSLVEQQRSCTANFSLVELVSSEAHSCRRRRSRRRLMSRELLADVAVEPSEGSRNEHMVLTSKALFGKKKTVPITFHEKDAVHVGLNKTVDLHVTVYVPPHESRRFLLADAGHAAEDRGILHRACPGCVQFLRTNFQNLTGRLSAHIN
ncbi:hypothetical protein CBR_g39026 [Chara braunii]|uniref:Uncharacterized protein n=1 Tax=Chara braunii TaxID=69332 RepID=A0A388LQN3_CHABU|nr:hypothetical protein CBR_g39026 [Chara braunii]|eukprot:GBG84650.1 hypothetical protein CBR_g39026 [Chara braunii]